MSRFDQFRQWLGSTSRRTDQGRGHREPITPVLLALVIILLVALGLLAGCAGTPPTGDKVNPPPDHCLRKRAQIDVSSGTALTVQVCDLWYFGPTREQDMRFRQNQKKD